MLNCSRPDRISGDGLLSKDSKILVAGAGGFIGGALIAVLRSHGYRHLRGVDVKPLDQWYQRFDDVENFSLDLNLRENAKGPRKAPAIFTTWPRTWAAWGSSKPTKHFVCCPSWKRKIEPGIKRVNPNFSSASFQMSSLDLK